MSAKSRTKHEPAVKIQAVKEYFQGASAKEIYAKYGVKERTVYAWGRQAREGELLGVNGKKNLDFLKSEVVKEGIDGIDNPEEKLKALEVRLQRIERLLKI
jgi:transposase-like protein